MRDAKDAMPDASEVGEFVEDERASDTAGEVMREMETEGLSAAIERLPERARYVLVRRYGLDQHAKGVARLDERFGEEIRGLLQSVKWYCWHGNVYEALHHMSFARMDAETLVYELEEARPGVVRPAQRSC
ncbi:MAG: hypothetical protein M3R38_33530 [Actinomycetota bacterium]|nr:hypothetical protein [Actinomycetota bacterium]